MSKRIKMMRVQSVVPWIAVVGTLASWSPPAAVSQQLTLVARTPRFFYASSTAVKPVEIDAGHNTVLGRIVSLHVEHTTIGGLLADIQRQTGLTFAYDPHFPATRPVTLEAESITVAAALGAILVGTGVDVVLTRTGHVWLTESELRTPRVQEGAIVGRVTDKQKGDPIVGATVVLAPTRQNATTGADGGYRLANLSPGNYTVRARYIGYKPLVSSATVKADQEATVDFPLERSAQQLEQIVTTGTILPTEARALPTPLTVIDGDKIVERHPHSIAQVIRQAIPTAVAFDSPDQPLQTAFSVRGVSSLSVGSLMKIYVDGIEASGFGVSAVDPASIERIEVLRGPQAATIYGADAAGGVVQIFTKRGDPNLARPQVDLQGALGIVQTPYPAYGGVLRQQYSGSVRGGSGDVGYNFGGSYTRLGDYLPNGDISRQSTPSVHGGMHFARGIIAVDLSARYYANKLPEAFNPDLMTSGFSPFVRANYTTDHWTNETYGLRIAVSPTGWWQSQATLGVDRYNLQPVQTQPRLTTPDDTLLFVGDISSRRVSIGFNTSIRGALHAGLVGSLTLGVDHYNHDANDFFAVQAVSTQGSLATSPSGLIFADRSNVINTGYYTQAQVNVRDALFVTAGLRAEDNSTFGADRGAPVLPRVGLSVVHQLGPATVKVRGAYGRAMRAPLPGFGIGSISSFQITLANPLLGPEQQQGWDAGLDLVFGNRWSLSLTGYNQTAKDLIAFLQVASTPLPTFQYQNIGRVENKGFEIEGSLIFRSVQLNAQYGYVHSRIEDLGPDVSPGADLQVGDQPLGTPAHTAGAALTVVPRLGTTLTAGVTYVGRFRQTDNLAKFRCFGGTGPCQSTSRDYVVNYPSFAKVNATFTQRLNRQLEAFVSVDNLTNNEAYEGLNSFPVIGRSTMVGLHASY
jgi:outer membrane receptor protein involved in Fe transport